MASCSEWRPCSLLRLFLSTTTFFFSLDGMGHNPIPTERKGERKREKRNGRLREMGKHAFSTFFSNCEHEGPGFSSWSLLFSLFRCKNKSHLLVDIVLYNVPISTCAFLIYVYSGVSKVLFRPLYILKFLFCSQPVAFPHLSSSIHFLLIKKWDFSALARTRSHAEQKKGRVCLNSSNNPHSSNNRFHQLKHFFFFWQKGIIPTYYVYLTPPLQKKSRFCKRLLTLLARSCGSESPHPFLHKR